MNGAAPPSAADERRAALLVRLEWAAVALLLVAAFVPRVRGLALLAALAYLADQQGDRVSFHVGGGIVADSEVDAEYEEALWKARFVTSLI